MQSKKETTIFVTAVGGSAVGRQVIKALQMAKMPLKIITADASSMSFGLYDTYKSYLIPTAIDKEYINRVLEICIKEKVKFIVPGVEAELIQIAKNQNIFIRQGIVPLINSKRVIDLCLDKWKTQVFLEKHNLPFVNSWIIQKKTDSKGITKYPVIVKPIKQGGGSRYVTVARNRKELDFYVDVTLTDIGSVLVQEYLRPESEEYTVGILSNAQGKIIDSIVLHRIFSDGLSVKTKLQSTDKTQKYIISSGFSQGYFDAFLEIKEACEKIALALESVGPLNIQCRKTTKGVIPFEINPRFSGTTSLRALVGFNEPEILMKHFLNMPVSLPIPFKRGYVLRELSEKYINQLKT